jgi:carbon monoxide dehydrogenase subunit G
VQLEQTFDIPSSAERVWRWFKDTEAVVTCLPGASLLAPPKDGKLQLSMIVKLGPITANFSGDGEVSFDDPARSGTVVGAAADRKSGSRIRGRVGFIVSERGTPVAPITTVALAIEQTIAGPLAQFSREGIVRELAQRLTDEFATRLRARIEAEDAAVPAHATADQTESTGSPALTPESAVEAEAARPAAPAMEPGAASASTLAVPPEPATRPPSPAPAEPRASPAAAMPPHRASPPAAASLNLGSLLWKMLVDRIRTLFGLGRKT